MIQPKLDDRDGEAIDSKLAALHYHPDFIHGYLRAAEMMHGIQVS